MINHSSLNIKLHYTNIFIELVQIGLLINYYFADFVLKEESIAVSKNGRRGRNGEIEQYVDHNWSDIRLSSLYPE